MMRRGGQTNTNQRHSQPKHPSTGYRCPSGPGGEHNRCANDRHRSSRQCVLDAASCVQLRERRRNKPDKHSPHAHLGNLSRQGPPLPCGAAPSELVNKTILRRWHPEPKHNTTDIPPDGCKSRLVASDCKGRGGAARAPQTTVGCPTRDYNTTETLSIPTGRDNQT
jgi:hypothetical protein